MLTRQDIEKALDYMDQAQLIKVVPRRGSSRWQQLYCPFHNNGQEKKPSCGCSLEEEVSNGKVYPAGTFNCFSCGSKFHFASGVKEILTLKGTSIEAHPFLKPYLEGQVQTELDSLIPSDLMSGLVAKYAVEDLRTRVLGKINYISEEELARYRFTVPYMYQRRLTDAVIEKYDVGYDANHIPPGRKKPLPCITFPVRDQQGRTLFICRRSIQGKYFNIPQNVEKSLYGIYELPKDTKEIIVCESVFNALTCVVYGHPAVALFGTGTTHEIEQLKRLGVPNIVLCLDNDEAGHKGTEKLKKALRTSAMVWTMTIPKKVPEDMNPDEVTEDMLITRDVNDIDKDEFEECYANRE